MSGTLILMGSWNGIELEDLTLTSARLTLRPWQPADAADVFAAASTDHDMREFLPIPDPYTRADADHFVTSIGVGPRTDGTGLSCALVETASGKLVGGADIRLPGPRRRLCDVGYATYPPGRGHGYAAEAADALARWAFENDVERVALFASVRNPASQRTALKAGFRYEGIQRHGLPARSGYDDAAQFARLASDSGEPIPPFLPPLPAEGLSDGVIVLRAPLAADAAGFYEETSDPVTLSWEFDDDPIDPAVIATKLDRAGLLWLVGSMGRLTMLDVETGRYAGSMQLRSAGPPQVAEIGYAVHPAFRGRGYTTRGLLLLTDWAFREAGYNRLELGAKFANIASQKAALNAGFVEAGIQPGRLRNVDGTFSDEAQFALLNPSV
jgi:RimJ/RimL family protein N-acetyltransferase